MPYSVGQVLFIILNKKMQVYPMMVVEEITKRTLQGEETNYVLQGGADSASKVLLTQVDGEVFESANDAKNVLVERVTSQIDKIVNVAIEKANEWYPAQLQQMKPIEEPKVEIMSLPPLMEEPIRVELPDGTVATLKKNVGMAG